MLSYDCTLSHSLLFCFLIAQIVQFIACTLFTVTDLWWKRVHWQDIMEMAIMSTAGFVPFWCMWQLDLMIVHTVLPLKAPSLWQFIWQFLSCAMIGDFMHYWVHRYLHWDNFFRNHVHSTHHSYQGPLFSWVITQVHPVEVFLINCAIYTPFFLIAHPMVLWTFAAVASLNATVAHSGYALWSCFPSGLTATDHSLHHDLNSTRNYGNIFSMWDRWFGTYRGV
jgi:sterol desaturase/sphingolipid hydroxylase (fatty acid hydroxylase superfamily)